LSAERPDSGLRAALHRRIGLAGLLGNRCSPSLEGLHKVLDEWLRVSWAGDREPESAVLTVEPHIEERAALRLGCDDFTEPGADLSLIPEEQVRARAIGMPFGTDEGPLADGTDLGETGRVVVRVEGTGDRDRLVIVPTW
jgi:hypothetical protein